MHSQNGFSLLELVIIIIIISILAVQPFINWPGTVINIDAQSNLILNDIRYAQSLSMSKEDRYRIVRTSATTYQILNGSGSAVTFAAGNTTQTLNSGLSFAWNNLTNNLIAFDSKGIPYLDTAVPGTALVSGTSYTIVVSGGGNSKTISITPLTGRVILQ